MSTHTDLTPSATADARAGWPGLAPWAEVARWAAVATLVAAVLLGSVAVIAGHVAGNGWNGAESGLLDRHHDFGDVLFVLRRNLLVLGIHLCACWIGAIIGRPHQPAPSSWGRIGALHRPVPDWMRRAALFYALLVTMLSVAVQAIGLGRQLADLAAATQISSTHLLMLVLPHAVPELLAVFLPLGLFLLEARRGRLDRLGGWSLQAAAIAVPVLVGAALIETFVTPGSVLAAVHAAAVHAAAVRAALGH
ncbi:MAG TPA: stage II sporulation protein M [Solirubrobacteraceae bacterium]|nr:stage II sporulation protein M [Solirubrobacteraceae bacterium]